MKEMLYLSFIKKKENASLSLSPSFIFRFIIKKKKKIHSRNKRDSFIDNHLKLLSDQLNQT